MSRSRHSILVALFAFTLAFGAGTLPTNARALNEVASLCQLPGAYLTETGLERLINLGVTELTAAFLNPIDDLTTRQKKKIQKAAVMLGGGVFAMTVCPPLIVDEGFSEWDYDTRLDYAKDTNWSPIDIAPMDDILVDNPADPGSCQASLQIDLDGAGKVDEGLDFADLEFVYVDPFGSFPNGTDLFNSVLEDIKEQIRDLINQYLSLSPVEDLLANIDAVNDRIVAFISALGINPTLNDLIPGLEGFILDLIGLAFNLPDACDSVDFECDFRLKFDKWATNLLEQRDDGVIEQFSGGFRFPDGPGEVTFLADINTGFSTPIGYVQELFVTEYFAPTFDVLFEENGFSVIADLDYEALEPGLVDRSYTPPAFQAGEIAVADNCDPAPFLGGGPSDTVQIGGPFYPEVFATDRSGNMVGRPDINPVCLNPGDFPQFTQAEIDRRCTRYAVKVEVMDTRAPDVAPKDPIGISVAGGTTQVNFTDPDIGCTTLNCQTQIEPPVPPLQPPPVFDFAQADFDVDCTATNSLGADQPCSSAVLPVGETTTIDWSFTDLSGNTSAITQLAAVREDGVNQTPAATGTTVIVAQNTSADIPLEAGDPEFDPISYIVKSLPLNGTLDVMPEAQFQTRFTVTGTVTDLVDALRIEPETSPDFTADIYADPVGMRLVAAHPENDELLDALYFETVRPDSIEFRDGDFLQTDQLFEQSSLVTSNLLIGDWSTRRIHGLVSGTNSLGAKFIPDAGYALPAGIDNPAHFVKETDYLYVTEPDPAKPADGRLHVIQLGSSASGPAAWTTIGVRTIDLGYSAVGISRISDPSCGSQVYPSQFVLGDWEGQTVRLLDFSDGSPLTGGSTEPPVRTWFISPVLTDPDGSGDNRADIIAPRDIGLLSNNCRTPSGNLNVKVIDDGNKDIDNLTLTFSSTTVGATSSPPDTIISEFVQLFGVAALGSAEVLTLDRRRIAKFDLFGNLQANVQTQIFGGRGGRLEGAFESDRLTTIDGTPWAAMEVDPGGQVYLLSFGGLSSFTQFRNDLVKITLADGSNNFSEIARTELEMPVLDSFDKAEGRGLAYSVGPTSGSSDDRVYALTEFGVERFDATLSNSTILFEAQDSFACSGTWCATVSAEFPDVNLADVDTDAMGNVYFSDLTNHRVHKFGHDGSYVGWLGACDSGADCDIPNGRSNGFLCTDATCAASSASGSGQGQFTFLDQAVGQDKPRPSSAMLEVNIDAEQIYVTDNPDLGAGAVPRAQIFSLTGVFVSETLGDGSNDPNDFLDAGDFNAINDLSTTTDRLFLIEDQPLKRLHVFDISPFQADLDGATVTYTPDNAYSGPDSFSYAVVDSFGAESAPALVDITVVGDSAAPTISCPADITVEATEFGGASRATFERGDRGSVALADFFEGATFSDDIQLPPPVLDIQIPVPGATLDYVFPVNATTPVQFQVFDGVGNFTNCVAEVTVEDTIRPRCNRPAPPVLVQNGDGPPTLQVVECRDSTVTMRTRTSAVIIPSGSQRAEDPQLVERGIETTIVTDEGGNETTFTQEYEIRDTMPPTFQATRGTTATQVAVNGYANPYTLPGPAVTDAADVTVECQPALSGTAASVPLTFFCQARDAYGNLAYTTFDYEIVQENADGDAFSDLVDPRPGVADDSDTWSDTPLGGATSGTYTPDGSGGDFRIIDAYLAGQGVRAEWTAPGPGAPTNSSVLSACGDTLEVTGFGVKIDEIGDVDVSAVSITCGPSAVRNHLGAISAAWTLPNDFEALSQLPESAGLAIDGYIATADADNDGPIDVQVADNSLQLAPGEALDLQPFANFRPTAGPATGFALLEDAQTGGQLDLAAVFDDTEDADVDLTFAVQADAGGDLLDGLAVNGTLLSFDVAADAFGTATLVASATDTGGLSASVTFDVVITPVNDAPSLSLAGDVDVFDFDGNTSIAGFASASPGPANESGQTVDISIVDVSNPALFASGPVIDEFGTLLFTPNLGSQGTANVQVVAVDSGGTDNGGADTDQQSFDIFVEQAERADVSVSITASDRFVDPQQSIEYTVEVVNNGPEDVVDVLVESAVPPGLVDATWFCVASDGACGAPNGAGDISQQVSIQSGGTISYTLTATVALPEGEDIVSAAAATPPADPVDTNAANNGDSVTVTVGLYADGFEVVD